MADIVIAKKDRAVIRATVDKCIKQISDILSNEQPDLFELELNLEQLNEASVELKKIDSDVKKLVKEAQLDTELETAEQYREKIVSWRFKASRKIKELNKKTENSSEITKQSSDCSKDSIPIKLPKLEINKFSGKHSEWLTFWSSFENAIHENKSLDPVDKFNYLKTYLTGSALKTIQGFAISNDNYFKCIDLLTERFGKKDILIQTHLSNIIGIQPVKNSNDTFSLRELYDRIQIQIRSLESLDVNTSSYESLLSPIILKLIPRDLLLDFHKRYINKSYSSSDILNFLLVQISAREKLNFTNESYRYASKSDRIEKEKNIVSAESDPPSFFSPSGRHRQTTAHELFVDSRTVKQNKKKCSFCFDPLHESKICPEVINLPFNEKLTILRKRGVCYRCLQASSHLGRHCSSGITCEKCTGPHASIMCNREVVVRREENKNGNRQIKRGERNDMANCDNSNQTLSNNSKRTKTYLQTIVAEIRGKNSSALIRIIVDSGSENSYVSKYVANKLNLNKINSEKIKHGLFGGIEFSENHSRYQFTLCSLDKSFSCRIQALDQDRICTGIDCVSDEKLISTLKSNNVFLSDIYENREICLYENNPDEIHLLLGADMAGQIFTQNVKYLQNLGLTAFGTKLGWVIMGEAKGSRENNRTNDSISSLSISLHVSNGSLEDLWRLDTLGISNEENKTKADLQEETQKYFLETVKRDSSGRFEVSLPWVVDPSTLPSNRSMAESALYRTEKKLSASKAKKEYSDIFNSWESDKIIEEVTDDKKKDRVHFLPHRPVIKESSETTKMRPVFNASAHGKNSPSLNDCLAKGPNLIEIIPRIVNRFRKYRIGISSDIEKAFLQIQITEKDRDFLRFFWFDNESNLKIYHHCRVVFGLSSSPFLLVATVKYLLSQVSPQFVETARILENSFYIDNSLTSLNSEHEIDKFKNESISILASGHFNLSSWRSNIPRVMSEETENEPKIAPVLGLIWDLENDNLMCKVDEKIKIEQPYTKRKILSTVQKFFDPIGFIAPVVLTPKLLLQQTWVLKLKWDEELPEDLSRQFNNWVKGIDLLHKIEIPRWLNMDIENENRATLHVFSDASKAAYATCAFIRIETPEGVKIQLVNARSRVSPLKELTIPRLELLSCLIGARIAKTISGDLDLPKIKTTFWSDSTTALGWIRREQSWGTYVHNRVLEIRKLSQVSDWRHVPGTLNPADLPSRGCSFEQLKESRWWEGPSWLYLPEDSWPQAEEPPDEELINKEKRKSVLTLIDKNSHQDWYYRYFSTYTKLVRMIAWMTRFIHNLRNKEKNLSPEISVQEFEKAEKIIFKLVQHESFTGKTDPKLKSLEPLEDENEVLRVRTRIINRNDTENFRYPILLPSQHPVVERLILETHVKNQHAGVGILISLLREKFWILKSRKTIRNIIRKCIRCQRFESKRIDAEPGVPPEDRVRDAAVFEVLGTDLAGPLYLSDGTKAWVVLFTCAIYRALHLELVSSLSTESFLQSLRRFIARRGRPYIIYSDNGTNFLGTANALSTLDWNRISAQTSSQKIRWRFNPPAAPWWGGWWERLVRIVKEILRKSLGRASLTYEELNTLLCDCEQVVNSRPITYISEDIEDLKPLTPLMFLQELPSSGVPDLDELDNVALNRRARYRQKLRKDLRSRFRKEYLGQLRLHSQKEEKLRQVNIGDIVLLDDNGGKRIHWPMAKVIELFPGRDGVVRLAKVQTETGIFLRPVQRLFPLEVCTSDSSDVHPGFQVTVSDKTDSPPADHNSVPPVEPATHVVTRSRRLVQRPQRFKDFDLIEIP